jgi:hypothetical protein
VADAEHIAEARDDEVSGAPVEVRAVGSAADCLIQLAAAIARGDYD